MWVNRWLNRMQIEEINNLETYVATANNTIIYTIKRNEDCAWEAKDNKGNIVAPAHQFRNVLFHMLINMWEEQLSN